LRLLNEHYNSDNVLFLIIKEGFAAALYHYPIQPKEIFYLSIFYDLKKTLVPGDLKAFKAKNPF
jgi:hypothetical protein